MTKRMRTFKATLITGIILVSVCAAIAPTTSAGIIFKLQSVISVTWSGNETKEPAIPRGPIVPVQLKVTYRVNRGAFGAGVIAAYSGRNAFVKLEILEKSEWVTASLQSDTVPLAISDKLQTGTTSISFQVQEDAPAYALGFIKIHASVGKLGLIDGFDQSFTLNFVPSYKPLINPVPATRVKQIGPMDTAEFPIVIENLGNAQTTVYLAVVDPPDGWIATIDAQVTLDETPGSKATVYLVVKPPKNFGYHYDEKTIQISILPVRADAPDDQGTMLFDNFIVESRGFSTPGFEAILFIGALLVVALLIKLRRKK